ncbi:hypothetical protein Tco_1196478 [Tanacetum coccineum]
MAPYKYGSDTMLMDGMRKTLGDRLSMVCVGDDGEALFTSHEWRRLFKLGGARRRMTWRPFILELGLHSEEEMAEHGGAEKVAGVDLFYLRTMDRGTANVLYLLAQYLFHHAEGRKSGAQLSGGHFIGRLAAYFGLVGDQGLRGLSVVVSELPVIDLHELAAEGAPAADEGAQAVLAPVQAPQPPPPEFESTLVGSSRLSYERHVRPRTGDVSTFTAP